jgi:hypothetical protein
MGDHLTAEQHARLAAELAELEGPKRQAIVQAIKVARAEGDLSENFEYHAAKNEQGLLERKITILRDLLTHAEIVADGNTHVVSVGSHVVVEDEAGDRIDVELSALGGAGTVSPSRRERPLHATAGVGIRRARARRSLVRLRGAMARGSPRGLRTARGAGRYPREGARGRSDRSPERVRVPARRGAAPVRSRECASTTSRTRARTGSSGCSRRSTRPTT